MQLRQVPCRQLVSSDVTNRHQYGVLPRVPCRHVTQRDPLAAHVTRAFGEGRRRSEESGVKDGDNFVRTTLIVPLHGQHGFSRRKGHGPRKCDVIAHACILDGSVGERR